MRPGTYRSRRGKIKRLARISCQSTGQLFRQILFALLRDSASLREASTCHGGVRFDVRDGFWYTNLALTQGKGTAVPTAAFATLGCKVNQYETQRILDDFEERGFAITEFNAPADVYVINTCSVTQAAERKSRQMVRRAAGQNAGAIVVMTGCYGEMSRIKGESIEEAALIVPNHQKLDTLRHLLAAYPRLARELSENPPGPDRIAAPRRTRATLKVQDGCNVFCTFCSIPYTRRYMVSRPLEELVREAEKRARQGYRELVVTGVLVGAYGQDGFVPILGADMPRVERTPADYRVDSVREGSELLDGAAWALTGRSMAIQRATTPDAATSRTLCARLCTPQASRCHSPVSLSRPTAAVERVRRLWAVRRRTRMADRRRSTFPTACFALRACRVSSGSASPPSSRHR